ncbi:hypothetical protein ACQR18_32010 [Bradyrhizobium oligotrophicum]|uniref:hypothetical protein n=1 Tax=Bradyrhizobium oligotrophicum TaxID=44255 RepID=UPI003EB79E5E
MVFWKREPTKPKLDLDKVKKAIVRVGKGRGFMIGGGIVTTINWLSNPPEFKYPRFETIEQQNAQPPSEARIVGRLDGTLTADADCVFADPISSVAILGGYSEEFRRIEHWEYRLPVHAPLRPTFAGHGAVQDAWFLSIDEKWVKCRVRTNYDDLRFVGDDPDEWGGEPEIAGNLSGSPIIDEDGGAIGIILAPSKKKHRDQWFGHHVVLIRSLPGSYIASISELSFPERRN